ncbi:hypothetical protein [Neisseria sp.]|uniref:hypothetical protein n=1 Tax=Neisseria sp. TaxID=192066 RepID=UPI0026DAC497|nr:hypothetical protein [Neisseria sp.]MDO4906581.1 hypothetical protein [Neisseria sp.]
MNFLWKILAPSDSFAQNMYVVFFIFIGMVFIMPAFYRLFAGIEPVTAMGRFAVPFLSLLATIAVSTLFTLFSAKLHKQSKKCKHD